MEKSNSPRPIGAGIRRAQYTAHDPIVVHRSAIPGETAISLASWTAALNGLSLRGFCRDFAIKHSDLVAGHRSAIAQLAELTGSDASHLLWHSSRHLADGHCSLMSETVHVSVLLKTPNRICPVCIANSCAGKDQSRAFQMWEWQLAPFRRCRVHDVMLEPLKPAKDPHDFAVAIQAWEPSVIRSSPCIDPRFEEYLVKRLESGTRTSWPDSLPIHVVILFCEAFGAMLGFGSDCSFEALSDEQKIEASALGFHHVAQGAEAVQSALQDFFDDAVTYRTTYGKLLAPVLKVLSSNAKDPAFDGLRDRVREFLRENFHIPDGTDILGEVCKQSRVYTAFKASREFEIPVSLINRELKKRGWRKGTDPNHKSDRSLLIPRREMLDCIESVNRLSSVTVVQALLGLDRFVLEQLEDAGLLLSYFGDDRGRPMYDAAEVAGFLGRLHATAHPERSDASEWVSLISLVQSLQCSTVWLITMMLVGHVRFSATSSNAFQMDDFRVCEGDVRKLLFLKRQPTVSISQIGKMLGINDAIGGALVEHKALEIREKNGARIACVGAIEAFNRDYILLRALAGSRKPYFQELKSVLVENSCRPLQLGATESAFYPRRHVYRLARSAPTGPIARLLENEAIGPRRSTPVLNRHDYGRGVPA